MKKGLFSKYKVIVPTEQKSKAINLILSNNIKSNSSDISNKGELEIVVSRDEKQRLRKILLENEIEYKITELKGALTRLELLKNRWGLLLGFIILVTVLMLSSNVVWRIDIEGNTRLSRDEIIEELSQAGFGIGTFIPKIDYDNLHNNVLLNSDELSWISVNITGNVASVKVKEKENVNRKTEPLYTNVVASSDGYIASIVVIEGKKAVSVGDVVKKGDVLISGVVNSQSQGVRYEHAQGEIKAYVNKRISVKIPFKNTKKVYTGNVIKNKNYFLYNFPLNFSVKYRNLTGFYDTIEKREMLSLLGVSQIPLEIVTTTNYEYVLEEVNFTIDEAVDIAFTELRTQMDAQLKNAELISKNIETDYDSESFYIFCDLYCLEDIAIEQEFFLID